MTSKSGTTIVCTVILIASAYGQGPCGEKLADISVFPGSPLYYNSTLVNNPAFAHILPAFVALPRTVKDVQKCLACAYAHSVPFTVKSGGHSTIGMSTIDGSKNGAFVIYLAEMKSVEIIGEGEAKIQAGATWEDIYEVIRESEYLIVGGICPSVGVAGFTLGGGIGFTSRKYGLAIDNVQSLTMITVDGSRVVVADADTNTDLYWALRGGGGGNFGVVVDFTFKLQPATYPSYVYGNMVFVKETSTDIAHVLSVIGSEDFQSELYFEMALIPGNKLLLVYLILGPVTGLMETKLTKLIKLSSNHEQHEYSTFWEARDAHISNPAVAYPRIEEVPVMTRAVFIKTITPAVAKALVQVELPKNCFHVLALLGGAISNHKPTDTAYFYRNVKFVMYSTCSYRNEIEREAGNEYLHNVFSQLDKTGDCQGNYLNNPELDLQDWQFKYYGGNYERLVGIQQDWNPLNKGTYHYVQSIGSRYNPLSMNSKSHYEL